MNEDRIRETCMVNPEQGFRLLVEKYQGPMYWHIRRCGRRVAGNVHTDIPFDE